MYVANFSANTESVINTSLDVVINTIYTGIGPTGFGNMVCVPVTNCEDTFGLIQDTACGSVTINDSLYGVTGMYTQHLINEAGCDSTLTIDLTVGGFTEEIFLTACDSIIYEDSTYFTPALMEEVFMDQIGCDSLITTFIRVIRDTINTNEVIVAPDSIGYLSYCCVNMMAGFNVNKGAICEVVIEVCP
ncbi:MAG: hypothetical protein L3J79_06470 [Candidatus Marinimicrobia bacterium]|nr:hypothetical protein [Candidatus Neomarinimicrobiota bacterium]